MSSDDLDRIVGQLMAKVDALNARTSRIEKVFITVGGAAIALVVRYVLKDMGLL